MLCVFLRGSQYCFFYVATWLAVAAHEYLIWGYDCWKTFLELLGSTTTRGTMRDDWLTVQQLLTAFHRNKFNEK
jgi:hypothetical protein